MNFVEELKWRGMLHDVMPGTRERNRAVKHGYRYQQAEEIIFHSAILLLQSCRLTSIWTGRTNFTDRLRVQSLAGFG